MVKKRIRIKRKSMTAPDLRRFGSRLLGLGTFELSLPSAESGARQQPAKAAERTGSEADAVRVSTVNGSAGAGGYDGES